MAPPPVPVYEIHGEGISTRELKQILNDTIGSHIDNLESMQQAAHNTVVDHLGALHRTVGRGVQLTEGITQGLNTATTALKRMSLAIEGADSGTFIPGRGQLALEYPSQDDSAMPDIEYLLANRMPMQDRVYEAFIGECRLKELPESEETFDRLGTVAISDIHKFMTTREEVRSANCMEHCMTPNLQPNKTEILFSLRGVASRQHKKDIYGAHATGFIPIVCEYGTYQVPVTSRYCHLGGLLHHVADQQAEIKRRVAIANAAMTQHSKLVFRNWALPMKKRVQLFEALILSKLLYGADTWIVTDDKTEKYFHAATIRLYRRLLPVSHDKHLHDLEILSTVRLPSPTELIRRARLRYVATLLHSGPRQEWGLLEQDKHWTLLVEDDMHWL